MSNTRRAFNYITRYNDTGTTNEITRRKWVEKVLGDLSPGLRLLDAGAGEQQYKKFCGHLTYVSQDFAQYNGVGDSAGLARPTHGDVSGSEDEPGAGIRARSRSIARVLDVSGAAAIGLPIDVPYSWESTPAMVADVQEWLDNPADHAVRSATTIEIWCRSISAW